jgi:hypothetical protein
MDLDFFFQKIPITTTEIFKPFSKEMYLKMPLLSRGLKLPNSKPGCRVSALHFFMK